MLWLSYAGRFDRVLQIDYCHLQPEPSNEIRNAVYKFAQDNGYTFYDPISEQGYLRNLTIRNTLDGQVMVILSVHEDGQEQLERFLILFGTVSRIAFIDVCNQSKSE